jgi:hypothetical protein
MTDMTEVSWSLRQRDDEVYIDLRVGPRGVWYAVVLVKLCCSPILWKAAYRLDMKPIVAGMCLFGSNAPALGTGTRGSTLSYKSAWLRLGWRLTLRAFALEYCFDKGVEGVTDDRLVGTKEGQSCSRKCGATDGWWSYEGNPMRNWRSSRRQGVEGMYGL